MGDFELTDSETRGNRHGIDRTRTGALQQKLPSRGFSPPYILPSALHRENFLPLRNGRLGKLLSALCEGGVT
jgi:hypothetical protein